jgi:hypothetical protein
VSATAATDASVAGGPSRSEGPSSPPAPYGGPSSSYGNNNYGNNEHDKNKDDKRNDDKQQHSPSPSYGNSAPIMYPSSKPMECKDRHCCGSIEVSATAKEEIQTDRVRVALRIKKTAYARGYGPDAQTQPMFKSSRAAMPPPGKLGVASIAADPSSPFFRPADMLASLIFPDMGIASLTSLGGKPGKPNKPEQPAKPDKPDLNAASAEIAAETSDMPSTVRDALNSLRVEISDWLSTHADDGAGAWNELLSSALLNDTLVQGITTSTVDFIRGDKMRGIAEAAAAAANATASEHESAATEADGNATVADSAADPAVSTVRATDCCSTISAAPPTALTRLCPTFRASVAM